jgi:uncharacterized protein DUF2188
MANRKSPVHVVRRGDKWAVIREGNKKASSVHDSREQAEKRGRSLAHNSGAEFFLHDEQHRVRERESHGPVPS